ncbi:MAG: hypothetical protein WCX97_03845 [Candidatus Magasanikbacteria bacterium]
MEEIKVRKDWIDKISFLLSVMTAIIVVGFGSYVTYLEYKDYASMAELDVKFKAGGQKLGQINANHFTNFVTTSVFVDNLGSNNVDNYKILFYFNPDVKIKNFSQNWEQLPCHDIFGENFVSSTLWQYIGGRKLLARFGRNSNFHTFTKFDSNFLGSFEISFLIKYFDKAGLPKTKLGSILISGEKIRGKQVDVYYDYANNDFSYDTMWVR